MRQGAFGSLLVVDLEPTKRVVGEAYDVIIYRVVVDGTNTSQMPGDGIDRKSLFSEFALKVFEPRDGYVLEPKRFHIAVFGDFRESLLV